MRARLVLENVPHSSFFLASSRERPDSHRFETVPGKDHLVQRIIPVEQLTVEAPQILSLYGYPDTQVYIEFQPEERDATGAASGVISEKAQALEALQGKFCLMTTDHAQALQVIKELRERVQSAESQRDHRITDEQIAQLGLYDLMCEALKPVAGEFETPLDVVQRLASSQSKPIEEGQGESDSSESHKLASAGSTPAPATFDEKARRAELEKMKPAKFAKIVSSVPGADALTERADKIEAILMHEAGQAV